MADEHLTMERLATIIRNEPLIEADPSIPRLSENLLARQDGAIYYGTGLTTPRALSVGLPFDVLGMVMVAEKLRRLLRLKSVIHHIADTHALANSFVTPEAVEERAQEILNTMTRVAKHLKIPEFSVVRSSSFDQTPEYLDILNHIETAKGEYVARELADMRWYKQHKGLALKMGWIIQSSQTSTGFDERLYDDEYLHLFGADLSFIYLKAGRTFDQKRPKASPYIAVAGEQRILLKPDENVQEKFDIALSQWSDKQLGGAVNHLNAIVRLYEKLVEPTGKKNLPEKIQYIIDCIFQPGGEENVNHN